MRPTFDVCNFVFCFYFALINKEIAEEERRKTAAAANY